MQMDLRFVAAALCSLLTLQTVNGQQLRVAERLPSVDNWQPAGDARGQSGSLTPPHLLPVAFVRETSPIGGLTSAPAPPMRLPTMQLSDSSDSAVETYEATNWASHNGESDWNPDCKQGCQGECCCAPATAHRSGVFGEFLYLRPRDAEVAYGVGVDGNVPISRVAIADPDYQPGYRVGFSKALDPCSSLVASYTNFQSSTFDMLDTNPAAAIRKLLVHPATANAAADVLTAQANYDVDFQFADVAYRALLMGDACAAINYTVGARYGMMNQDLRAIYTNAGLTETVVSDVEFEGAGFRLGLDTERHTRHHGFLCYGRADASFLAGEVRTAYSHGSTADPVIVDTSWKAGRIVSSLELEVGAGWQSACGRYRLTTGYVFSAWLNTVSTDSWIQSVRNNNFVGLNDATTFDGLTAKAEYRF